MGATAEGITFAPATVKVPKGEKYSEAFSVVATTEARQKANNNNNAANALSVSIAIVGLNAPKDGKLEMSGNILAVMTTTTTSTSTTTTTTTTTPSTTTTTSTTTSTS